MTEEWLVVGSFRIRAVRSHREAMHHQAILDSLLLQLPLAGHVMVLNGDALTAGPFILGIRIF